MIVKGTDVIGLKVITKDTGEQIEAVEDVLYSASDHRVHGLLLNAGGIFSEAKVILIEDVRSIGENAVIIDSKSVLKQSDDIPKSISWLVKSDN